MTALAGRKRHPMLDDVADALGRARAHSAYAARPAYQRNDYLGWIGGARKPDTRRRRIAQMISELQSGDVYMKMPWHPKRASRSA